MKNIYKYLAIIILNVFAVNPLYSQTTFSGATQTVIVETSDSTMILPASNAVPEAGIIYNSYSGNINGWSGGNASWQIQITRPSNITIYANYTSDYNDVGLTASVNSTTINQTTPGTGGWGTYLDINVGQVTLNPGIYTFYLGVTNNAMNFSHVRLTRTITPLTLTTSVNNTDFGFVVKSPYQAVYEIGDTVRLTAVPGPGYSFDNWTGDITSSNATDTIIMAGNQSVTANFIPGGVIYPDGKGNLTLPAGLAVLDDAGISLTNGVITSWDTGSATWNVDVSCPTTYIVRGDISGPNTQVNGQLTITVDGVSTLGNYTTTGNGYNSYAYQNLTAITLQPGSHSINISRVIESGVNNAINLRTLQWVIQENTTVLLFVKTTPTGNGDGSSWDNAYNGKYLAKYLRETAIDGTKIFVAEGTYIPYIEGEDNPATAREYMFELNQDIEMRGGYKADATGVDLSSYNPANNVTRLSGEIQNPTLKTDNSYHVVKLAEDEAALIDGFYISDGYADQNSPVDANNGGGVIDFGGAQEVIRMSNLIVENNAANFGGGIYFKSQAATVLDSVTIRNNSTLVNFGGGGIFAWGNFALLNSTISNNSGDGILTWGGDILLRNSTISNNTHGGILANNTNLTNIRLRLISATIAQNGGLGLEMRNTLQDSMSVYFNNNLVVNNKNGSNTFADNINFATGAFPIDTVLFQYSIAGNKKFGSNAADSTTLPVLVQLGPLDDNGGWGQTHALLDSCDNPAVGAGDIELLTSILTDKDQRGILRIHPPSIGAYDGLKGFSLTTWTALGDDSNWNNPDNWSNGIPSACAHVILPEGLSHYPVLEEAGSGYSQAICDTIEFQMGSEVGQQQLLQYRHAKVQLKVSSTRWFMISPSLRDMYSGDYFLQESFNRQSPGVYMMKYQSNNPETGAPAVSGSWSNPFNSLTQDLVPGSGYAIWIDKPSNTDVSTFFFPQDSTAYSYYYRGGSYWYTDPRTMSRTNYGRFGYETGNWNGIQGSSAVPAQDPFTMPIDGANETAIVGNPFMSHLDFTAFRSANSSAIENSYYIWSGGDFTANIVTDWGTISSNPAASTFNNMIAPLQSFIVKKANGAPAFTSLNFSFATMSKTYPDASTFRSSGSDIPNLLHLEVLKNGEYQSAVALLYRDGQANEYSPKKDSWTLFNDSVKETTVIYALLNGKAVSIHTLGDWSKPIELGIRTTKKGPFALRMTVAEQFDPGFDIYLKDKTTGKEQNLSANPLYSFENTTGNIQGRFFLSASGISTGTKDVSSEDALKIYSNRDKLYVKSTSSDPIQQVEIYDAQGLLIYKQSGINEADWEKPLLVFNQVLIIKVQALHKVGIKKIYFNDSF